MIIFLFYILEFRPFFLFRHASKYLFEATFIIIYAAVAASTSLLCVLFYAKMLYI